MQTTKHILLIRPCQVAFNVETAASNAFQNVILDKEETIKQRALMEFKNLETTLRSKGVEVTVIEDTPLPQKPDAVFPNNWVSFHADGTVILYPMYAPSRRLERRPDIIELLKKQFIIKKVLDLSHYEKENKFLEGTGSIVFDHQHKIAYACLSPRTNKEIFIQTCDHLQYKPVYFFAHDRQGKQIYHTNVMMCIAEKFAVVCLESISDTDEREKVLQSLATTGHELIDITFDQMNKFTGNMLELQSNAGQRILALSESAYGTLSILQRNKIQQYCELVPFSIKTIETVGGGSVRCMIAEIFLQPCLS